MYVYLNVLIHIRAVFFAFSTLLALLLAFDRHPQSYHSSNSSPSDSKYISFSSPSMSSSNAEPSLSATFFFRFFDFETALLLPLRFLLDFYIIFCSWLNHHYSVTTHHYLSVSVSRKITPYHLGGGLSRYVRCIFHIIWWIFSQFLTVLFFESNSNGKIDAILEVT